MAQAVGAALHRSILGTCQCNCLSIHLSGNCQLHVLVRNGTLP